MCKGTDFWHSVQDVTADTLTSSATSSAGLSAASKQTGSRQPSVYQPVKHQVQEVQDISGFAIHPQIWGKFGLSPLL